MNIVPLNWVINLGYSYWQVYTPWMFVSSIAIGIFLAWACATKILPRCQIEKAA